MSSPSVGSSNARSYNIGLPSKKVIGSVPLSKEPSLDVPLETSSSQVLLTTDRSNFGRPDSSSSALSPTSEVDEDNVQLDGGHGGKGTYKIADGGGVNSDSMWSNQFTGSHALLKRAAPTQPLQDSGLTKFRSVSQRVESYDILPQKRPREVIEKRDATDGAEKNMIGEAKKSKKSKTTKRRQRCGSCSRCLARKCGKCIKCKFPRQEGGQ